MQFGSYAVSRHIVCIELILHLPLVTKADVERCKHRHPNQGLDSLRGSSLSASASTHSTRVLKRRQDLQVNLHRTVH